MNIQGSTAKYGELSNQAYGLIVDTFAAATRSRLNYWNSVWEIASRPYASTAIPSVAVENVDRANELAKLTVNELRSRVQRRADFSEKLLEQVGRLQASALETYRDSLKSYLSTADQVKHAASEVPVDRVSTVDQVSYASAELSRNGFQYGKTPANPVSVAN